MKRTWPLASSFRARRPSPFYVSPGPNPYQTPSNRPPIPRPVFPPVFSLFTLPNDTQDDVLSTLQQAGRPPSSNAPPGDPVVAAVVLATPRHASWLTDIDFMAGLVRLLRVGSFEGDARLARFRVVAAVVDGLPAPTPDGVAQEGFSIATGLADRLLPDWAADEEPPSPLDTTPSSIRLTYSGNPIGDPMDGEIPEPAPFDITLPLANTLFSTGRRSTLLASEWRITTDDPRSPPKVELSRVQERRREDICLANMGVYSNLSVHCHLEPVTRPRTVESVLGNIISQVEIDGVVAPASDELQRELPRWLEKRKQLSPTGASHPGSVSVWALVTPWRLAFERNTSAMSKYERLLWKSCKWFPASAVDTMVQKGAHLHRVLSGGGEWGPKAGLIALDPQVQHQLPSEEESLESFRKSFEREGRGESLVAKPKDIVQFFVQPEPTPAKTLVFRQYSPPVWGTKWGAGDVNGQSELREKQALQYSSGMKLPVHRYFGGCSAEGLYVSVPALRLETKIDVPGSRVEAHIFREKRDREGPEQYISDGYGWEW